MRISYCYWYLLLLTNIAEHSINSFALIKRRLNNIIKLNEAKGKGGKNWIERSTPTGMEIEGGETEYSIRVEGGSFELDSLSKRIYETLKEAALKRFAGKVIPSELENIYKASTLNIAALEATKVALGENKLEKVIVEDEQQNWGKIELIEYKSKKFSSIEDVIELGLWEPGESFSFVVRNVLAKEKEMTIEDLMAMLDPSNQMKMPAPLLPDDPSERITSLKALSDDNERRCNDAHTTKSSNERLIDIVISIDKFKEALEGKDSKAISFIMEAFETHSCLILQLNETQSLILNDMWNVAEYIFEESDIKQRPPPMNVISEAGSKNAVVGYASYENDQMQFLETRLRRSDFKLFPTDILPPPLEDDFIKSFHLLGEISKHVTQIVVEAANNECNLSAELSHKLAQLATNELLDDGTTFSDIKDTNICMSPHRFCQYSFHQKTNKKSKEIFGAHTDSTFVTILPCASTPGLEIYNDELEEWFSPETIAKQHFQKHSQKDSSSSSSSWHSSYVCILPGELLQILTRSMILSAVHRVVINSNESRMSVPALIRARSNAIFDAQKYFGENALRNPLLKDCNSLTMEQVHDALQPSQK